MKFWRLPKRANNCQPETSAVEAQEIISGSIEQKIAQIQKAVSHTEDMKLQYFNRGGQSCVFMYLEPLVNQEMIQSNMVKPLLDTDSLNMDQISASTEVKHSSSLSHIIKSLLEGFCIVIREHHDEAYLISAGQWQGRSIEEPKNEQILKGSHDGFIESLNTNLYLIRRRIKSPRLKVKFYTLGRITNTRIAMVYMEGIAEPNIIAECEKRISSIELDYLYSAANLDEMIEEHPLSPFPQTLQSGRPDRTVSYLMEGKINLIVDGSPVVLILPITFFSFYQSADDYYHRWIAGSFFRLIRLISFILAISLPAFYIAVVTYHSDVLPFGILYSIKVSLTYVPFPPLMEAITMQFILELLKEAAIRLPSPISQTIGIVGGLVIGTAVVEANLVSNTMIVVIALTAIASFATPLSEFGTSLRILGFPTMLAAALFGFFGIAMMMMVIFIHLCKIETLGVPFFAPFGPFRDKNKGKDLLLRLPIWTHSNGQVQKQASFFKRWKRT
ncbi:spore germination protein [Paenibacillus sp. NPDC056579]|uniref:spore germination protein n=1 Tax=unclassified Paenibacillus TaxID=185978 RepID=UPI001EF840A9|nr:spore germination protein [Paenibacillus sp. H1-7]ULL17212.1 spore germination protein [Paenibacillus sp. H1-7]